jgi:hypothetical protein
LLPSRLTPPPCSDGLIEIQRTLGDVHELGVHYLIEFCHNDARRHQALIDMSKLS